MSCRVLQVEIILVKRVRSFYSTCFRFIYTERIRITENDFYQLLYVAEKYELPLISKRCEKKLPTLLTIHNVGVLLDACIVFEEHFAALECVRFITSCVSGKEAKTDSDSTAASSSSGGDDPDALIEGMCSAISRSTLEYLLKSDALEVPEIMLFMVAVRWAQTQFLKKREAGGDSNAQNMISDASIREQLGNTVYSIRFPLMSYDTFENALSGYAILSDAEQSDVWRYYAKGDDTVKTTKYFSTQVRASFWLLQCSDDIINTNHRR